MGYANERNAEEEHMKNGTQHDCDPLHLVIHVILGP